VVICLERGADGLHMVPNHLIFLVPVYPGCPVKEAVKRVSVCLAYFVFESIVILVGR